MMKAKNGIAALGVAAMAWSTQSLAEKTTTEFASGATRPQSIALLPVEATVTRAKVVDTEGLVDDSVTYGALFNAQLEALLTAKGYTVVVVDADRMSADSKLQEYVVDANRAHDDMMSKYKPKKLESRVYTMGDPARLLADHLGVDAVGFSTLTMTITGAGKAIVSGLLGGSTQGTSANFAIVDGSTGDLEAIFWGIAIVTPGDKTDQEMAGYVATVAERTTSKVPGADPSSRIDVAQADDDVLDEVESLLRE